MSQEVLLTYIVILSANVVFGDDYTCCYGKSCPLPVFYQYGDYQYFIDNFGIIDEDKCCPHTPWLGSSGIDSSALWNGETVTLETACRCKHAQTCGSGDNLADSVAYTCDGGCMTKTGCPDAYIEACWYWGYCAEGVNATNDGCVFVGHNLCTYNAGSRSTTTMTQRCDLATTVCVHDENGILSGEYNNIGFYYGFPNYQGPHYFLHVERLTDWTGQHSYGIPRWTFAKNISYPGVAIFNQNMTGAFDDITSISSEITYFNGRTYTITISEGVCIYPTPEPTPYPTDNDIPSPTSKHMNGSSAADGGTETVVIVAIVVGITALLVLIVAGAVYWMKRDKRKATAHFVKMDTIQH